MSIPSFSIFTWIVLSSLVGGVLSVAGAGVVALNARTAAIPMLISYAIGAMLGAVFLEIMPEAISAALKIGSSVHQMTASVLFGILYFQGNLPLYVPRVLRSGHHDNAAK